MRRIGALVGAALALLAPGSGARAEPAGGAAGTPTFRVIGHRGAAGHAPENTIPALERARELGVAEVELDVQLSRDGVPVLFHDSALDDKTDLEGRVSDHGIDSLRHAEIGRWFDRTHPDVSRRYAGTRLAALDDALGRFGSTFRYHLEIKGLDPGLPSALLEVVGRHGLRDRVVISSFEMEQLERIRALDPGIPTCWLLDRGGPGNADPGNTAPTGAMTRREQIARAVRDGVEMVGLHASELGPEIVREAHARGLEIRAWGVRSDRDVERALASGSDGMTIDWPERIPNPPH